MFRFATLQRPTTNNTHLRADPADTPSAADGPAVAFAASPEDVMAGWDRIVRQAPRTRVVAASPTSHHAVQRSKVFRLPDDIYAEARPAPGGGARLLIYSASRYGRGDLGVNKRRVAGWVEALTAAVGRTR